MIVTGDDTVYTCLDEISEDVVSSRTITCSCTVTFSRRTVTMHEMFIEKQYQEHDIVKSIGKPVRLQAKRIKDFNKRRIQTKNIRTWKVKEQKSF